jgi:hypothetical protein
VCCLLSTLSLALSACASRAATREPMPTGATLAAHGIECHKERATGSLVEATVCTSAAERARAAEDAQKTKDQMNNVPAGPCTATGPCH